MTTVELIAPTIGADYAVVDIDVSDGPKTYRLIGDTTSATITLYIPKIKCPHASTPSEWMKMQSGGSDVTITSNDNKLVINYPCVVRFVKPSSSSHAYGLCEDTCNRYA